MLNVALEIFINWMFMASCLKISLHNAIGFSSCIWYNKYQKLIPCEEIWLNYLFAPIQVAKSFSNHSSLTLPKRSIKASLFSPHSSIIMGLNLDQFSNIPSTVSPSATLHKNYNIGQQVQTPYFRFFEIRSTFKETSIIIS